MSNKLNETFKKHLGLLHKKLNEGNDNLVSMIERYVEIIETLASISLSRDGGDPSLEDEKKQIKNQIISSKGQEYFNMVDEFVELKVRKGNQSEVESLANQLGLPQLALSEVTNEGNEPDGLMGAVVSSVKSENGIVYIRLDAKTKDGLATMFDAKLV